MATGRNVWSLALLAGCALAGAGATTAWLEAAAKAPPAGAVLGTPEACARHSGLPAGWGHDMHAGMVHIPGGSFVMGTTLGYPEEREEVEARVDDFWIDATEVTVAQFTAFVEATGHVTEAERQGGGAVFRPPDAGALAERDYAWWTWVEGADWRHPEGPGSTAVPNHPVTLVTLSDALAYARWLGRDLPTEAEWEYAAKAGRSGADIEREPRDATGRPAANFWQGVFPAADGGEDGHAGLAPVGCYAANPFKLYDMIGNAWEQTLDVYTGGHDLRDGAGGVPPPAAAHEPLRVIKGGSFLCSRDFCVRYRPSAREGHEADLPTSHIGFRTVLRQQPADQAHVSTEPVARAPST